MGLQFKRFVSGVVHIFIERKSKFDMCTSAMQLGNIFLYRIVKTTRKFD